MSDNRESESEISDSDSNLDSDSSLDSDSEDGSDSDGEHGPDHENLLDNMLVTNKGRERYATNVNRTPRASE